MTSNTTEQHIKGLQRAGRLVLFEPILQAGEAYRRRIWMHPDVSKFVNQIGLGTQNVRFHSDVRATFKRFVIGDDFDDDGSFRGVGPKASHKWELKITFNPQHRFFGGILRNGEFVATSHENRAKLGDDYGKHLARIDSLWTSLFQTMKRSDGSRSQVLQGFNHDDL